MLHLFKSRSVFYLTLVWFMCAGGGLADDAPAANRLNARQVVEAYIAAVFANNKGGASALAVPGTSAGQTQGIDELREGLKATSLEITQVYTNDETGVAMGVSEEVKLTKANPDGNDTGCLVSLEKR